jgi:two-component system chemotaxis response regulator CheB
LGVVRTILSMLPAGLDAAVLVALHTTPESPGHTVSILQRATTLDVGYPCGLEPLLNGRVYVAPPGRHLQVAGHCAEATQHPLEHYTRPAVDVLFRSAARDYERQVIAVLLSGAGSDGAAGVVAVHQRGGIVIVQAPEDAAFDSMPRRALDVIVADYILPAPLIGDAVKHVVSRVAPAA